MERITEREERLIKNALAFAAGTIMKEMEPDSEVVGLFLDFINAFAEHEFSNFCECQGINKVVVENY